MAEHRRRFRLFKGSTGHWYLVDRRDEYAPQTLCGSFDECRRHLWHRLARHRVTPVPITSTVWNAAVARGLMVPAEPIPEPIPVTPFLVVVLVLVAICCWFLLT